MILFSSSNHDTIASSLAISFASRVVQEVTRRPRQLMDEPRPCSSMTSKSCQARDILSIKSFAQSTASATVALTGRSYFAAAYPASHNSPTTTLAGHDWRRRCEKSLSQVFLTSARSSSFREKISCKSTRSCGRDCDGSVSPGVPTARLQYRDDASTGEVSHRSCSNLL